MKSSKRDKNRKEKNEQKKIELLTLKRRGWEKSENTKMKLIARQLVKRGGGGGCKVYNLTLPLPLEDSRLSWFSLPLLSFI